VAAPLAPYPTESARVAVAVVETSLPVAAEAAPAPVERPPVMPAPAPVPAPAAAPAAAIPPAPQDLDKVLKESGLQLVQTKADAKVEIPPEPEFVPAKRPRRPPPADLGQPLQIVETRKE